MTRSRLAMWSLAAAAAVGCGAMGQSSSRGTMVTDDGQSRRVLHFSEPDLDAVRRPDFELSDVTVFVDTLLLSEAQRDALRRLIGKYLDDYAALVKARNPELDPGPGRSRISAGLRAVRGDESGDESAEAPAAGEIENHQRGDEGDVQRAPGGPGRSEPSGGGRMDPVEAIILDELKKAGFETDSLED